MDLPDIGVIVIGRNEGRRLISCLESVCKESKQVIYVDSASSDESVQIAKKFGAHVIQRTAEEHLTAASARNQGFEALLSYFPHVQFVQFLDGDSELFPGWLEKAKEALHQENDAGIVCGNLHEKNAEASLYNRLCELEWKRESGPIRSSGGIFMIRTELFAKVQGFNPTVIAAEDDELCLRIQREGWKILHLNLDMATHQASLLHFSQWWKRAVRCGFAYAQGFWLHGTSRERHFVKEFRSVLFWGLLLPLSALFFPFLLIGYPFLWGKIFSASIKKGWEKNDAILYTSFCLLGKFPNALGLLTFHFDRLIGKKPKIIEYKEVLNNTKDVTWRESDY